MKTSLEGKKILIVDDEPDLREMLEFEFDMAGAKVMGASSGSEAFETAKSFGPDAIVSDIRMPGGDGVDLLKNMQEYNPNVPILFISGFADIQVEEAYDLGASAYFAKPFIMNEVVKKVANLMLDLRERWVHTGKKELSNTVTYAREFPSIQSAAAEFGVEFGRGGVVLTRMEKLPRIDSDIEFDLSFQKEGLKLTGQGVVRWNKKTKGEKGICCGVDILTVSPSVADQFISLAELKKKRAFIPKVSA